MAPGSARRRASARSSPSSSTWPTRSCGRAKPTIRWRWSAAQMLRKPNSVRREPPAWRQSEREAAERRCSRLLGLAGRRSFGLAAANGPALGDTRRLSGAAAQIIELGPAHVAAADHLDMVDDRRIEREDALDAFAEADLADGEAG